MNQFTFVEKKILTKKIMPTNPHYESVRKAVISACPELMDLTFGCQVSSRGIEGILKIFGCGVMGYLVQQPSMCVDGLSSRASTLELSKDQFKIIGHPIRLASIIRTLGEKTGVEVYGNGIIQSLNPDRTYCTWNLIKDDLAQQDPSVWEALDKMLSV